MGEGPHHSEEEEPGCLSLSPPPPQPASSASTPPAHGAGPSRTWPACWGYGTWGPVQDIFGSEIHGYVCYTHQ